MSGGGGATDRVRQELAQAPVDPDGAPVELGALLRAAGTLARRGPRWRIELVTTTGATARRAHVLLRQLDVRPTLHVREATNVAARQYGVVVDELDADGVGRHVGLLDDGGRPTATAPPAHEQRPADLVRGALLGSGSVSSPRRPPHLELRTTREATAQQLAGAVEALVGVRPSVGATKAGHRAVLKSGSAISDLVGALGATTSFLAMEEQRLRRQLRADTQRLVNADAANLRRAVDAAGAQVAAVEDAIRVLGWDALPGELRDVALARLANPAASLAELGQLCDPPVGKSAVHRRLARLRSLVDEARG